MTPRTGSSLLCKGLEYTGVAGKPNEFFNISEDNDLLSMHGTATYEELRKHLWQNGSTSNNVFGVKHSMFRTRYEKWIATLSAARAIAAPGPGEHETFWADLLPNVKHIHLTRRNKIRQVVSWWKAIQTDQWHLAGSVERKQVPAAFYNENYDFAALAHLYHEIVLRECATEAYFAEHDIVPLPLVYEDMVRDYPSHLRRVLAYLGLHSEQIVDINNSYYQRTANADTEIWVTKFRNDLQKSWGKPAY